MIFCCLVLPKIKPCFYFMGLLLNLGLLWYTAELFSSGVDLLKSQLPKLSQHPIKLKKIERLQCRSYCHHTKFKPSPSQKWQGKKMKPLKSVAVLRRWASLPDFLPHIPLLQCFPRPPTLSVICAKVCDVLLEEANWEQL
jgi:hypothetical protein